MNFLDNDTTGQILNLKELYEKRILYMAAKAGESK